MTESTTQPRGPFRHSMAFAAGFLAAGAVAVGVLAIRRLAIRRLEIDRAELKSLTIETLTVGHLVTRTSTAAPVSPPAAADTRNVP